MSHLTNCDNSSLEWRNIERAEKPQCFKNRFKDILLVIVYHFKGYDSMPLLASLYRDTFPNIAYCGPTASEEYKIDIVLKNHGGLTAYHCLGRAVRYFPRYKGYFYINDDMIVNWWNFADFDMNKIWQSSLIENGHPLRRGGFQNITYKTKWVWYNSSYGIEQCNKTLLEIKDLKRRNWQPEPMLRNLIYNGNGRTYCSKGWSDVFYIPGIYAEAFADMSEIFYKNQVFLEIAVTTMLRLLDKEENTIKLTGHYLPDMGKSDGMAFWTHYRTDIKFMHPFKFHNKKTSKMNIALLKNWVIAYSRKFLDC
eukprot:gene15378-16961_t